MPRAKSIKDVHVLHVGMIMRALSGTEYLITDILDEQGKSHKLMAKPEDNSMILQLNYKHYLVPEKDVGWSEMDERIMIVNVEKFNSMLS